MSLVGLITSLNGQFQGPMQDAFLLMGGNMKGTLATCITFAFFLAYLVMGSTSAKYIENHGYKKTLITGLIGLIIAFGIYELSAYVFETYDMEVFRPTIDAAKKAMADAKASGIEGFEYPYNGPIVIPTAYYVFLLAAFVAGSALTFLQAVLNPYIAACNVKGTTAVTRGSIAGSGNSTMTTIGPLIVAYVIFSGQKGLDIELNSLYIPFLVLIVLVAILIGALTQVNLPSIASAEKKEGEVLEKSVWSFRHLTLGVVAIFMYVGVEVAVGNNINLYAKSLNISDPAFLATIYWGLMLVGRLCGTVLNKVSAQTQLAVTSGTAGILVLVGMVLDSPYVLIGAGLFHSVMWGAIFALAIDQLGKYTSAGSGALMMGVVGGAVLPLLQGICADVLGEWQWTWIIVVLAEAYLFFYAVNGYKVKQLP